MGNILLRRKLTLLATTVALTSVGVLAASPASASASHLSIKGPTSNTLGQPFTEKITGHASGKANYLVAWEQFNKHGGCSKSYAGESTRTLFQNSKYELTLAVNKTEHGHFTQPISFQANNAGTHGLCAYLINLSSGKTYAHASKWWNNHQ